MRRLIAIYPVGSQVKVQNPELPGVYTVVKYDRLSDTYTLRDDRHTYEQVPGSELMPKEYFHVGDLVKFKDGHEVYQVTKYLGDNTYFLENDHEAITGVRGTSLELI